MKLLILLQGDAWDHRYQASALAASAASTGDRVDLALFFGALAAWIDGRWDRLDPLPPVTAERLEEVAFPPLSGMLEPFLADGALRLFACSTSARILGLDLDRVQERVHAIVGWQSFSRKIAEADRVVSF